MSELPKGWTTTNLQQLFELKYGKGLVKEKRNSTGSINVYGSNGVVGKHSSALTKGPAIIIGRKGSVGEINFSPDKCWPIDTTYYIDEFPDDLPPKYWTLYLKFLRLSEGEKSSAIPGINRDDIYKIEVHLPPLNEQRRIVSKLEKLLSRVEAAQARLAKIPLLLKRFRQSVLAAACTGKLTADLQTNSDLKAQNWEATPLRSLLSEPLTNGRSIVDAEQGFPVLRLTCLKNGAIDLTEYKIGAWTREQAERFLVRENDFLVSRGNGSLSFVGRGGLVGSIPNDVAYPDTMIRVRVESERILPQFLSLVWDSHLIRKQVENAAHTTAGIFKINQRSMESFILPVPTVKEQHQIVRRVDAILKTADLLETHYLQAKAKVDKLMQSILARAFRGTLVPQDPRDQPVV